MGWNTYGNLLKPASIGSMRLKNRICMAPMDFKFFSGDAEDSTLTEQHIRVFEERARGGAGLIFTCATQAELEIMPYPHDMQFLTIHRDERIKDFTAAADAVHVWGVIDLVANTTLSIEKRYGLVYVDRHDDYTGDFSHYRKKSFDWYKHVIETNGDDLS